MIFGDNQSKKIIINDSLKQEIKIYSNDNYEEQTVNFITKLKEAYECFQKQNQKLLNEWNSNDNNKFNNVYVYPECQFIKSPMTILDGEWGSGKTHFIEEIAKNWNSNSMKENRNPFQNFISIDVWKFCSSENIVDDITNQIFYCLINSFDFVDDKKNKKNIKLLIYFFKKVLHASIPIADLLLNICLPNNLFSKQLHKIYTFLEKSLKKTDQKKFDDPKILKNINENIKHTIIVFDNVERMGVHSWEIIKTIQKLSFFDKLLFILPINKKQLKFGNDIVDESKNECSIDKFITLGTYFELKTDYFHLMKELGFDNETAKLIDYIFRIKSDKTITLRTVKKTFISKNIKKHFDTNKYEGLKEIINIWKMNNNVMEYAIRCDLKEIKNYLNNLTKNFQDMNDLKKYNVLIDFFTNKTYNIFSENDKKFKLFKENFIEIWNNFINVDLDLFSVLQDDLIYKLDKFYLNLINSKDIFDDFPTKVETLLNKEKKYRKKIKKCIYFNKDTKEIYFNNHINLFIEDIKINYENIKNEYNKIQSDKNKKILFGSLNYFFKNNNLTIFQLMFKEGIDIFDDDNMIKNIYEIVMKKLV